MEKFFLKVLHEEPVAELSLHELVGGGECGCYGGFSCPCHGNPCNVNCPSLCSTDGSFGGGEVRPLG